MTKEDLKCLNLISKFVPPGAELYCFGLWKEHDFTFKIHKPRKTKLGDFRYSNGRVVITVNNDLNPFGFLVTYLHEVAHLVTYKKYKNSVLPHGIEWKKAFQDLMTPVLHACILPTDITEAISSYIRNPKATSCSDQHLLLTLAKYDPADELQVRLRDLKDGEEFIFRGTAYKKIHKRRTRSLCLEIVSGKQYLISEMAEISLPSDNNK